MTEFTHRHFILSLSKDASESETATSDEPSSNRFHAQRLFAYTSFDKLRMRHV
jgi:hypothetical protein